MELIKSTEAEKLRCALLMSEIIGLDVGSAEQLVDEVDRGFAQRQPPAAAQASKAGEDEFEDDEMDDVSAG